MKGIDMSGKIYKPKGKAQEYAESTPGANDGYAVNLYKGCPHRCKYCYVPLLPPWKFLDNPREAFHATCKPFPDVLKKLGSSCKSMVKRGLENNPLHLCFTCDPYPTGVDTTVTRKALQMLGDYGFGNVQVLTKGREATRDFDLYNHGYGWRFGVSMIGYNLIALDLMQAHQAGIRTWASIEPVLLPRAALNTIRWTMDYTYHYKIGKLNHGAQISPELGEIEANTDWAKFVRDVKTLLPPERYMLKDSLKQYEG